MSAAWIVKGSLYFARIYRRQQWSLGRIAVIRCGCEETARILENGHGIQGRCHIGLTVSGLFVEHRIKLDEQGRAHFLDPIKNTV